MTKRNPGASLWWMGFYRSTEFLAWTIREKDVTKKVRARIWTPPPKPLNGNAVG